MYLRNRKNKYGAKASIVGGIRFASKLELYCYNCLNKFCIPFEFQKTFELQPSFKRGGKTIRSINIIIDFYIPIGDIIYIVDTKGKQTKDSKIKHKMLKYKLHHQGLIFTIRLLRTNKEVGDYIIFLKSEIQRL